MFWKILAKPHEQSGLYKYKISKHALEFKKKTKLYVKRAYNLISIKNPFKRAMEISIDKKQNNNYMIRQKSQMLNTR